MKEPESWSEARVWMRYAEEDAATAGELVRLQMSPRHACFLAQQAAEKAIKAILVFCQIEFPRTHDLEVLSQLVPDEWSVMIREPNLATCPSGWSRRAIPATGPKPTCLMHRLRSRSRGSLWMPSWRI